MRLQETVVVGGQRRGCFLLILSACDIRLCFRWKPKGCGPPGELTERNAKKCDPADGARLAEGLVASQFFLRS